MLALKKVYSILCHHVAGLLGEGMSQHEPIRGISFLDIMYIILKTQEHLFRQGASISLSKNDTNLLSKMSNQMVFVWKRNKHFLVGGKNDSHLLNKLGVSCKFFGGIQERLVVSPVKDPGCQCVLCLHLAEGEGKRE